MLPILWIAWCGLHSALISRTLMAFIRQRFPNVMPYHRLAYNAVAIVTLIPVLAYGYSLRDDPWFAWQGAWRMVQIPMALAAILLFVAGGRRYDFLQFLGLRQAKAENDCQVLTDNCQVDTSGVLSMVRHPWYTGGILIVWVRPLDLSTILTNVVITIYFVIGAYLEERKLREQFGRDYEAYQERVSMFLPLKWVGRRLKER